MSTAQNTEKTGGAGASQTRSLWHNRDYLLLVGGQIISTLGSQFSLIAFPLLALFISGSPAEQQRQITRITFLPKSEQIGLTDPLALCRKREG